MSSLSVTSPTARVPTAPAPVRAADGDDKPAVAGRMAKDPDGDDKAGTSVGAARVTAAAKSSSAVQSALVNLQKGG